MPLETETLPDGTVQYKSNSFLSSEDLQSISLFLEKSTSKKERKIRSAELFKIV